MPVNYLTQVYLCAYYDIGEIDFELRWLDIARLAGLKVYLNDIIEYSQIIAGWDKIPA
jgi:hypothetical protein